MEKNIMRTTVTLDENLVRELVKIYNAKSKTAAVAMAAEEQIRRAKLKKLASLMGKMDIDEAAIIESEQADLKRAKWLDQLAEDTEEMS